jgi:hypothetical protein
MLGSEEEFTMNKVHRRPGDIVMGMLVSIEEFTMNKVHRRPRGRCYG